MSATSLSEKRVSLEDEKKQLHGYHSTAESREVDAAAQLSTEGDVDPVEAARVRCAFSLLGKTKL